MTNRLLGALIVALFCVSTASAIPCAKTSGIDPAVNNDPPGTTYQPVLSGVVYSCGAFSVPSGETLTRVDIIIANDYSLGLAPASGDSNIVDFSDTFTGFNTTNLSTFVSGGTSSTDGGINPPVPSGCSSQDKNTVDCAEGGLNITTSFGPVTVTGSSIWVKDSNGVLGGVGPTGSDQFNVQELFTLVSTPTPEPASLLMIGGGLAGLALLARRKRQHARPSGS